MAGDRCLIDVWEASIPPTGQRVKPPTLSSRSPRKHLLPQVTARQALAPPPRGLFAGARLVSRTKQIREGGGREACAELLFSAGTWPPGDGKEPKRGFKARGHRSAWGGRGNRVSGAAHAAHPQIQSRPGGARYSGVLDFVSVPFPEALALPTGREKTPCPVLKHLQV